MTMNSTCYKQYDTRWASLPYPKKPWLIRNCGCGEVSICNAIIDMKQYANETPKTIQPYMKQFAESRGNGTYHYGIPTAMKHFGMTEVAEHATMSKLWAELRKGGRNAVLLMGSRSAGSKGVKWTGCGHFVEISGYKEEGGKHWVYVKDSASTSSYRNGWITYEDNIRGACLKCWSGKLNGSLSTATAPTVGITSDGKLTIDGIGGISTVKAMQRFFGTTQDGVISGQNQSLAKWYPALKSVKYAKGGSPCVKNLQRWLGIKEDGIWGKGTSTALQKKIGVKADGIFGKGSMSAWQKYLNANEKAVYPTTTWVDKANAWARKISAEKYHYVKWNSKVTATHTCPICTGRKYDNYFGWNCIGYSFAVWFHGGNLKNKCSCSVISSGKGGQWDRLLKVSQAEANKLATSWVGVPVTVIRNGGKAIPLSQLKAGDICCLYSGGTAEHIIYYMGNGKYSDSNTTGGIGSAKNIRADLAMSSSVKSKLKLAIRYCGK